MTSSGCGLVSGTLSAPGPSATIPFTTTEAMFAVPATPETALELSPRYAFDSGALQPRPLTLSAYGETARWLSTVATPGAAAAAARAAAASCSECTWP